MTGASDSGVQFIRHGFRASVFFAGQAAVSDADVVVVDTDTRWRPAQQAYARTRRVAEQLAAANPSLVYKKVDSTLRGNLGAEIEAVMDAFHLRAALIAPAFPRIGRTTLDGRQYLHGVPVNETEAGRDPKTPVTTAVIKDLLASQSRRPVANVPLAQLRAAGAAEHVRALVDSGASLLVCDAVEEEDLRRVAAAGRELGVMPLWVGSAGLADVLPGTLGLAPTRGAVEIAAEPAGGPVLLVVGSVSSVSRRQLYKVLGRHGVTGIEVDTVKLVSGGAARDGEVARCVTEGFAALQDGQDVAIYTSVADAAIARSQAVARKQGLTAQAASEQVAAGLGMIAGGICREMLPGGLVLTGGDTALAVCQALGVTGIDLIREVEPGIPLGRLVGPRPYAAVTKAGAFGSEQALVLAMDTLKGRGNS